MMKQITTTVCATMLMASCSNINNTEQQVNQQVDELYSRMSQPEAYRSVEKWGIWMSFFDAEGNLDTLKVASSLIPVWHWTFFSSTPVRNWLMPISCESVWLLYKIG